MKIEVNLKHKQTGKTYQLRSYHSGVEVWVDLGCGWFKSDYEVEDLFNGEFELRSQSTDTTNGL